MANLLEPYLSILGFDEERYSFPSKFSTSFYSVLDKLLVFGSSTIFIRVLELAIGSLWLISIGRIAPLLALSYLSCSRTEEAVDERTGIITAVVIKPWLLVE